jgi:hypothetical protein
MLGTNFVTRSRRTTAKQELLALITTLSKLIVIHLLEKTAVSSKRSSLPSGAIRAGNSP